MEQPGMMIYFDVWEPFIQMGPELFTRLMAAAIRYARYGTEPSFTGAELGLWQVIRLALDRDRQRYIDTRLRRRYAVWCRYQKQAGKKPLPFREWSERFGGEEGGGERELEAEAPTAPETGRMPVTACEADRIHPVPATATASATASVSTEAVGEAGAKKKNDPSPRMPEVGSGREAAPDRSPILARMLLDRLRARGRPLGDEVLIPWARVFARLHEQGYRYQAMREALERLDRDRTWQERIGSAEDLARYAEDLFPQIGGGRP